MFEQSLETMKASIYFDDKGAEAARLSGVSIERGHATLSYQDAAEIVEKMKRLQPSVSKYILKRYTATMNQIRNAFGPEFWERH